MKYKVITEQIIKDIQSQKLIQGQRLPSLRQSAKQLGVSMTTVLNCYHSLEEMGWLEARPKSGFFISTPQLQGEVPAQPQFKSKPADLSDKMYSNDLGDYISGPLGISQLSPTYIPLLALKRCIKRGVDKSQNLLFNYSNPQGVYELRQALASHFNNKGFPFAANDLFISNGCMDAVRKALAVTTKPGDSVAISSPCYNGLINLLTSMSRKVVEIPCNSDGIDLQQLELNFKNNDVNAALLSSSHMNPHGLSLSVEQKKKLANLANKYCIPIIEDDVYGELGHDQALPLPIKYWDSNGYVLWCSSVSKTLASGLRIGWCLAGRYLNDCIDICDIEHHGQNGVMQIGLAEFINSGQYPKHLQRTRKIIFDNACAYRYLLLENLPSGSAVSIPMGGLVLWLQIPNLNLKKLKVFSDAENLDIRFGAQFTTRKLYQDCFRINVGWGLQEMHDSKRTIKQALLQLTDEVHKIV